MRLTVTNFLNESSSLGSPGLENIQRHKPVFPGDTLRLRRPMIKSDHDQAPRRGPGVARARIRASKGRPHFR